ncbi:MAG TPA: hypothetical protein VFY75_09520 [Solirubrobacterales bacterium]|nr:hypothetical protein [Solirubrobacterales bacterium]
MIGVKASDSMRRQPPPKRSKLWKVPRLVEELQEKRQTAEATRLAKKRELEQLRHLLMSDQLEAAEARVARDYGADRTLEDVLTQGQRSVNDCEAEIEACDIEITCLLWEKMYPGAPSLREYDQREHQEVAEGRGPLDFDHTEALITLLWEEIIDGFADAGFGENAEILVAMQSRLGLGGICQLVVALRQQEAEPLQQLCDLVKQQERRTSPDCYNRLIVRRAAQGALVIVVDQPGNLDYLPPLVPPGNELQFHTHLARGARQRRSRGKPLRRRGSRRVTSRSAGGGDDPDPEPKPLKGVSDRRERTMWEVAMTGMGWTLGSVAMGQEGAIIGAVAGFLWSRYRWE